MARKVPLTAQCCVRPMSCQLMKASRVVSLATVSRLLASSINRRHCGRATIQLRRVHVAQVRLEVAPGRHLEASPDGSSLIRLAGPSPFADQRRPGSLNWLIEHGTASKTANRREQRSQETNTCRSDHDPFIPIMPSYNANINVFVSYPSLSSAPHSSQTSS